MKAPDKIYLQICGDCNGNDCENCKFEDLEDTVTWWKDKIFKNDIEYTRTDAFIDKACEFLKDKGNGYISIVDGQIVLRKGMIKDFIKYMKGE